MSDNIIRWKKEDYSNLRKAVVKFNKKISQLEKLEKDLRLPDIQNYIEQKHRITTRKELNRYINSLNRFSRESQQREVSFESGEKITQWEKSELLKARKRVKANLNAELESLNKPLSTGFSPVQMGYSRVKEIKRELERLDKLEKKKQSDYLSLRNSIFRRGTSDYILRKQIIYKENFLKMLKEFKSYKGYKEFKNLIENKNPKEFYELISAQESLNEIRYYYKVKSGEVVPEGLSSQEHFVRIINRYLDKNKQIEL